MKSHCRNKQLMEMVWLLIHQLIIDPKKVEIDVATVASCGLVEVI